MSTNKAWLRYLVYTIAHYAINGSIRFLQGTIANSFYFCNSICKPYLSSNGQHTNNIREPDLIWPATSTLFAATSLQVVANWSWKINYEANLMKCKYIIIIYQKKIYIFRHIWRRGRIGYFTLSLSSLITFVVKAIVFFLLCSGISNKLICQNEIQKGSIVKKQKRKRLM